MSEEEEFESDMSQILNNIKVCRFLFLELEYLFKELFGYSIV